MNTTPLYLGLDIGGTKSAAVLGNAAGDVLARREWPSRTARGPEPMLADLLAAVAGLRGEWPATALTTGETEARIVAAGISIGGPLDTARGVVLSPPHLPGWDAFPLRERLESALGLPVAVEHDAAACALAEYTWGAAAGASPLLYLTCGTGFGAGLLLGGQPWRSAGGHSMELGHARFAPDGPELFGKRGSIEGHCAGAGIPLLAAQMFPERWGQNAPTVAELAALAKPVWEQAGPSAARHDISHPAAQAAAVLEANARAVGQVAANLADLLFPEAILLGSMARHLGGPWVAAVRAQFQAEAHPHARACRVEPASLGGRLQDLSALVVALRAHSRAG